MFGKAANYKAILKRTGICAADAISIGDEVRDGEAAGQAGIDFGAVSWGYARPARYCGGFRRLCYLTAWQIFPG